MLESAGWGLSGTGNGTGTESVEQKLVVAARGADDTMPESAAVMDGCQEDGQAVFPLTVLWDTA